MEVTKKDLGFINNIDLRVNLLKRLEELDRVFPASGNYSTIFLAISSIEGIFKHIATIFRTDLLKLPDYPLNCEGRLKRFEDLSFMELYRLLKKQGILPNIKDLEHIYNLFKDLRNFIHPLEEERKDWPIDLGQAQMALGLLNATIGHLAQYIFIDKEIFRKLAGNPDYDSSRVLHLKTGNTPLRSFLVLNRKVSNTLCLNFDLELTEGSVLNFVFNFKDEGNFKMLRLDSRSYERTPNSVLYCTEKYLWKIMLRAKPLDPPRKPLLPVEVKIDFPRKVFSLDVDGDSYSFKDKRDNGRALFDEINRGLKIGLFNEEGTVRLSNIRLSA